MGTVFESKVGPSWTENDITAIQKASEGRGFNTEINTDGLDQIIKVSTDEANNDGNWKFFERVASILRNLPVTSE